MSLTSQISKEKFQTLVKQFNAPEIENLPSYSSIVEIFKESRLSCQQLQSDRDLFIGKHFCYDSFRDPCFRFSLYGYIVYKK